MDPNKIDCNVLTYYMNRIYSFLTSPKTSQVFPGLSKDVEDILVKVAGQSDLKLQGYDDDFKALVSVIETEIERRKGEYLLSCDFQELACGTRSLIYTKTMIPITFKQPQPLRKPNSMMSNKQPVPASSELITQSFKLRCLNATLKFVKDETRVSLRYPEMATEQAQHVINMFEHSNSDGDLGLGYKTLYAPLWEAMKIFGLKYKFTLKYTDPRDKNMKCLVLDKVPIVHASNKENLDQNSLINLDLTSDESTPMKNKIKIEIDKSNDTETFKKPKKPVKLNKIPKLVDTIKLLGDEYMTLTYKRILNFVMDEASGSMMFADMSLEQAQVLTHWNQIMKSSKYNLLLSGNCLFVLSQLSRNYKRMDFSVMVNEGKRCRKSLKRNVTFTKVPLGEESSNVKNRKKLREKKATLSTDSILKKSGSLTSLSSRSSVELNSGVRSASRVSAKSSATQVTARSSSATRSSASQVSVAPNRQIPKPVLVNSQVANPGNTNKIDNKIKISNTKENNKIKMKLLEGLDQPVTSDKAIKMMLNMGWEGGALGTRGEGITEPIRPSLDTGKRYGLGAPIEKRTPKPETPPSKTKQYHAESLKLILDLLTSDSHSKEITLPDTYMKKEWNYIKNLVIVFNKGSRFSVSKKKHAIADQIVEILYNSDWILTTGLKTDRRTIVIKKSILPLFPNELKLFCEIAALTESKIYKDGTFKDIYKGLHHRNPIRRVEKTYIKDVGVDTKDIVKIESAPKDLKSDPKNLKSDPKNHNKDTVIIKPLKDVAMGNMNKPIDDKDSNNLYATQKITEDFKCNDKANSDDDLQLIEDEDVTIIIASGDESDLLKSDSDDELSIGNILTKLNDYKTSSKEKSDKDKLEKDNLEKDNNNNLEKDDNNTEIGNDNSVKDNLNSEKESQNIGIIENMPVKVGKENNDSEIDNINSVKDNLNSEKNHNIGIIENMPIKVGNDLENTLIEGETSKESPGKRSRSNSQNSLQDPKRLKRFCKKIAIVPENYPETKMDDEKAREIQKLLLDAINNHSKLPLLKCHGIKNGTLIYSCHTEKTFQLIEKIVTKANLKIIYEVNTEKCNKKMAFRISTYIEEATSDILNRLVKFNEGLNIDHWIVIKKEQHSDFVVVFVNIDNKSYSYLKDVNFSLYAGVDLALFTHVWD